MSTIQQNKVNHVVLNLDGSASIRQAGLQQRLIETADNQIKFLKKLSTDFDQETRVSVYVFSDQVECLIWDMDVLRLPSIADLYKIGYRTALVAAVMKSHRDLAEIPQRYGDHAYLSYTITDGGENESLVCKDAPARSQRELISVVADHMKNLPDNWRVGIFVPNSNGAMVAENYGFLKDNISTWDATSIEGLDEAAGKMEKATERFFADRAAGVQVGTRGMFSMDADALNANTVAAAGLKPLNEDFFQLVRVAPGEPEEYPKICDWVPGVTGHTFKTGMVYQELVKPTEIQGTKKLLIVDNGTDLAYSGTQDQVRSLLGLGRDNVKVSPQANKKFSVFVQSKSTNRKPVVGQRMLLTL